MSGPSPSFYGYDWPEGYTKELAGLVIGKKWREFAAAGIEFRDPWVPMLESLKSLYGDALAVSPWTEQHVHDWVMEQFLLTWGCASSSKALLLDEPLYYPDHVGCVGDAKVGDVVLDAGGGEAEIVAVHDQVDAPLYEVMFSDGASVICSEDHLWTVHGKRVKSGPDVGRRKLVPVAETVSAKYLASLSEKVIAARNYRIPLTQPVAFRPREVPLDPYVLGCLLGDGHFCHGHVTLASSERDVELRSEFAARLPAGYVLRKTSRSAKHVEYRVTVPERNARKRNAVAAALKGLGLYGLRAPDKFIPDVYKVNSVEVRLDMASGLLDTDGWACENGRIGLKTTSKTLALDFQFLMESLGAVVKIHERPEHRAVVMGRPTVARVCYDVLVLRLPLSVRRRLFRLSRKHVRALVPDTSTSGMRNLKCVKPVLDRTVYPRETRCITLAPLNSRGEPTRGLFPVGRFVVTHNSNDTGALIVADWITDPYDTVTLVGSTTKDALRYRTWESVERYFSVLKQNPRFALPGKITQTGYAILNDRDSDGSPQAQGSKAGIHGVALNDGGKLQGAHLPYVRLVIDELATVTGHQDILTTIENLQIAKDFRFVGLANPETWSNPSCQYAIPEQGVGSVNVDTGSWRSTFGCFVRHHDGLKSPCVLHPELASEFPFLTQQRHIDAALKRAGGNADAPHFWKMVRGFPMPVGDGGNVVLDEAIAVKHGVMDPAPPFDPATWIASSAGVDPAWTENGDNACYARCWLRRDRFGRQYLDFTGGLRRLTLDASRFTTSPAVEQLRNQVVAELRNPYSPPYSQVAVDSSGNQGLADDLIIYAGASGILSVNNAERASEAPLRAFDGRPAKEIVYDRGTEAWCVLAEFCRAGQVKGLPPEALSALTSRRFAAKMVKDASGAKRPAGVVTPLRLERKEDFKARFGRSPDECDACANAALAMKERVGIVPFGYVSRPTVSAPDAAPAKLAVRVTSRASMPPGYGGRPDDAWSADGGPPV